MSLFSFENLRMTLMKVRIRMMRRRRRRLTMMMMMRRMTLMMT